MEMKSEVSLLFYSHIISPCLAGNTLMATVHSQYMFDNSVDHKLEELGTCSCIVSDQPGTFLLLEYLGEDCSVFSAMINADRIVLVNGSKCDEPGWCSTGRDD